MSAPALQETLAARLEGFRAAPGGNGWVARCPACALDGGHDKGKDHLRIFPSGAFRCNKYSKDSASAEPIDHNRIIRAHVYQDASAELLATLQSTIVDPEPKLDADKVYPEGMLTDLLPDHRYWVGRGISEEVLRRFEGGLHPPDTPSKMSGRYLFPIRDYPSRRIVGWTGRLAASGSFGPKWKHLARTSRCLYPLTVTAEEIGRARKIVLYESVGDGLAAASAGIWCFGILLGLNLNSRWLGWLVGANLDQIIISTNNDALGRPQSAEAGNRAAERLRAKLVPFFGEGRVKIRLPQTAKDWGECNEKRTGELELFKAELEGGVVYPAALPEEPAPEAAPLVL